MHMISGPHRLVRTIACSLAFVLSSAAGHAESPAAGAEEKVVSGMSIVGNDEAPKSLVIVPWKSSDLGDSLDVSQITEDGRRPVDREVFSRELDFFEIRTGTAE